MRLRTLFCGFICGSLAVLFATSVASMNDSGVLDEDLRQAVKQAGQRGDSYQKIRHIRRQYAHAIKWWSSSGANPNESQARSETEWILDDRFVTQRITGTWLDIPFKATVTLGYDNVAERYTAFWMDTLANRMLFSTGKLDESGETITMHGEYADVITRESVKVRSVFQVPTRQRAPKLEMYRTDSKGKEFKFLEVTSERRISAAG